MRWQHVLAPPPTPPDADVTDRTALPQIMKETLIGSQANYKIQIKITIYFYKIMISYEKYSALNLY